VQDFLVEDRPISPVEDHLTGSLAEPKATSLMLPFFLLASLRARDAPIALACDLDLKSGVLEAVPDGIRDHRIWDYLRPVAQG
jgi:hypothetical protein